MAPRASSEATSTTLNVAINTIVLCVHNAPPHFGGWLVGRLPLVARGVNGTRVGADRWRISAWSPSSTLVRDRAVGTLVAQPLENSSPARARIPSTAPHPPSSHPSPP